MIGAKKRVALVTGSTSGIGKSTAIALARTGEYNLALHYHSADKPTVTAVNNTIRAALLDPDTKVIWHKADLSQYDNVRRFYREVTSAVGHPDVLFANAGSTGGILPPASLADVPIDIFEATWRVNAGSAILLAQLCLPHMEAQGFGRIVFNSSVAGFTGGVVGPHYASSKSAIHGFVHWLAMNVAKKGVTVNAVAPALIADTNMIGNSEQAESIGRDKIPVGRLGRPEEVAQTVLWMIGNAYVTNKVIAIDGGMYPY